MSASCECRHARTQKLCQDGAHAFLLYKGLRLTVLRTGAIGVHFRSAAFLFLSNSDGIQLDQCRTTAPGETPTALLVPAFDVPHG